MVLNSHLRPPNDPKSLKKDLCMPQNTKKDLCMTPKHLFLSPKTPFCHPDRLQMPLNICICPNLISILYYNPLGCIKEGDRFCRSPYKILVFYITGIRINQLKLITHHLLSGFNPCEHGLAFGPRQTNNEQLTYSFQLNAKSILPYLLKPIQILAGVLLKSFMPQNPKFNTEWHFCVQPPKFQI